MTIIDVHYYDHDDTLIFKGKEDTSAPTYKFQLTRYKTFYFYKNEAYEDNDWMYTRSRTYEFKFQCIRDQVTYYKALHIVDEDCFFED